MASVAACDKTPALPLKLIIQSHSSALRLDDTMSDLVTSRAPLWLVIVAYNSVLSQRQLIIHFSGRPIFPRNVVKRGICCDSFVLSLRPSVRPSHS